MTEKQTTLEIALFYLEKYKWSVIPSMIDLAKKEESSKFKKRPLVKWGEFQNRLPTVDEVKEWWTKFPMASINVIAGKVSGIIVIDIDDRFNGKLEDLKLPETVCVKTISGGKHFYFSYREGIENSFDLIAPGIEVKSNGSMITVPPSEYTQNTGYEWIVSPEEIELAPFPEHLIVKKSESNAMTIDANELIKGVGQGSRNSSGTKLLGSLLHYLPKSHWDIIYEYMSLVWNKKNSPPLPQDEIDAMCKSIIRKESNVVGDTVPFDVISGKKVGELLTLETTFGKVEMTTTDFISPSLFKIKVFTFTDQMPILPDKKLWDQAQRNWAKKIEGHPEEIHSLKDVVAEILDDLVAGAYEESLGMLKKGIPIKVEGGIMFKSKSVIILLKEEKGLEYKREELFSVLKELGCEDKRTGKDRIRVWFFKVKQ